MFIVTDVQHPFLKTDMCSAKIHGGHATMEVTSKTFYEWTGLDFSFQIIKLIYLINFTYLIYLFICF